LNLRAGQVFEQRVPIDGLAAGVVVVVTGIVVVVTGIVVVVTGIVVVIAGVVVVIAGVVVVVVLRGVVGIIISVVRAVIIVTAGCNSSEGNHQENSQHFFEVFHFLSCSKDLNQARKIRLRQKT